MCRGALLQPAYQVVVDVPNDQLSHSAPSVESAINDSIGCVVRLQRGLFARLRFVGFVEFLSFIGVLTIGFFVNDELHDRPAVWGGAVGVVAVVVMWGATIAVRVAIALEFVEASEVGVSWRSLFLTRRYGWDQIDSIGVVRMWLFPSRRWRGENVLEVRFRNGSTRRLRASAWCEGDFARWIRSATELAAISGLSSPVMRRPRR